MRLRSPTPVRCFDPVPFAVVLAAKSLMRRGRQEGASRGHRSDGSPVASRHPHGNEPMDAAWLPWPAGLWGFID